MSTFKLTRADAYAIGTLVEWIGGNKLIRFSTDGGVTIRTGTLRHIVVSPDNFAFIGGDEDIRDGHVRITTGGWDITVPFMDAVRMVQDGMMATV